MENVDNNQFHIHETPEGVEDAQSADNKHKQHKHTHQQTRNVINRLSRASGHLESVKRMVEDQRDCSEVLVQLNAVISALHNAGKVILKDHIDHCIVEAVETGDRATIENLTKIIDSFIK